jgi:hypothetical protein
MPAVDPQRLEKQVEQILSLIEEPDRLLRETLELLDFYADRTSRPGTTTDVENTVRAFHVPGPVQRRLMLGIAQSLRDGSAEFESVADSLWSAGYRETMLMASSALSVQNGESVARWAEARAADCEDRLVLEHLGGHGLEGWRRFDEGAFLQAVESWLEGKVALQTLALQALLGAAADQSFRSLPEVFEALEGRVGRMRGARWKTFEQLMRTLARRSPLETTRFVLEAMEREDAGATKLARTLSDALPSPQKDRIAQFLSR